MYQKSAAYYDALYGFKDYDAAAKQLRDVIHRIRPNARRLLDVACGTGRHLEVLRQWYEVEGVDVSQEMLEAARQRLPGVPLHRQDMIKMDLGQRFDVVVCLFSSIAYVRTVENMHRTIQSFARHLMPAGLLVLEPFFSPEQYWMHTVTLNTLNEPDLKVAWMYTSDPPENDIAILNIHFLIGTPDRVDHFTERHELGLFRPEDYTRAFRDAGLTAEFDPEGFFGRGAYVATLSLAS